jgi:hypothetical protein
MISRPPRLIYADIHENINDLSSETKDTTRFVWSKIDEKRWSKNYPYQLAILKVDTKGNYLIYQKMVYTLPIGPEQISISTPFATQLTPTLSGMIEQHGGAPLRDINFSASFGVLPVDRPRNPSMSGGWSSSANAIAGGTISAVKRTATALQTALSGSQFHPNVITDDDLVKYGTGYYQCLQLRRFLESYHETKKTTLGSSLRLGFFVWKSKDCYIVTPIKFDVVQNASSPFEYKYSLALRAWRRIDPEATFGFTVGEVASNIVSARDASFVGELFQRLQAVRDTIDGLRDTVLAIRSDFEATVGTVLRTVALIMSSVAGLVQAARDFPDSIKKAIANDLKQFWSSINNSLNKIKGQNDYVDSVIADINKKNGLLIQNGVSDTPSDPIGLIAAFTDPKNSLILQNINPKDYVLSTKTSTTIDNEVDRVQQLSSTDLRDMQLSIEKFSADYADKIGVGSESYNLILGRTTSIKIRDANDDDFIVLNALSELSSLLGSLAIYKSQYKTPTWIEVISDSLSMMGVDLKVPSSKLTVPFPYNGTLERLAQQYLGDATRWNEIALLNELHSPYVNEIVYTKTVLMFGSGRQIFIADGSKLVIGQVVELISDTRRGSYLVVDVQQINDSSWSVTLSGTDDLSVFTLDDNAYLSFYDPYTLHGGQLVYIPSNDPASQLPNYALNSQEMSAMLQIGDIDWALNDGNDLIIKPDGDIALVYGLSSLIQWVRIALSTPKGSLLLHPEFGLGLSAGMSDADVDAQEIIAQLNDLFTGKQNNLTVNNLIVGLQNSVLNLGIELGVIGTSIRLPLSFRVI